jgi:hypothetical protein
VRGQKTHFPIGTAIGLYNSLHYRYDRDGHECQVDER